MEILTEQLEDIVHQLGILCDIIELAKSDQNKANNEVLELWLANAHRENALKQSFK